MSRIALLSGDLLLDAIRYNSCVDNLDSRSLGIVDDSPHLGVAVYVYDSRTAVPLYLVNLGSGNVYYAPTKMVSLLVEEGCYNE